MGIEPTPSAWKAEVLPLNYTRLGVVVGEGFEPSKAEPADLQSAPFDRSGTPPLKRRAILVKKAFFVKGEAGKKLYFLLSCPNFPGQSVCTDIPGH